MKPTIEEKKTSKHELKVFMQFLVPIAQKKMTSLLVYNDKPFKVGDYLVLKGYDDKDNTSTEQEVHAAITFIIKGGQPGLDTRYLILNFKVLGSNVQL